MALATASTGAMARPGVAARTWAGAMAHLGAMARKCHSTGTMAQYGATMRHGTMARTCHSGATTPLGTTAQTWAGTMDRLGTTARTSPIWAGATTTIRVLHAR